MLNRKLDQKAPLTSKKDEDSSPEDQVLFEKLNLPSKSFRPSSAKAAELLKQKRSMNTKHPPINLKRNQTRNLIDSSVLTRLKPRRITMDKERLYEENMALKLKNNNLLQEILRLRTKVTQAERELAKREDQTDSSQFSKPVHMINSLKSAVKELKGEIYVKDEEISKLKKNIKSTKLNEIELEVQAYIDECTRLRHHLEEIMRQRNTPTASQGVVEDKTTQNAFLKNNLIKETEDLSQALDQANGEITKLKGKIKELEKDKKKNAVKKNELTQLKGENVKLKGKVDSFVREIAEKEGNFKEEISKVRRNLNDAYGKISNCEGKIRDLIFEVEEKDKKIKSFQDGRVGKKEEMTKENIGKKEEEKNKDFEKAKIKDDERNREIERERKAKEDEKNREIEREKKAKEDEKNREIEREKKAKADEKNREIEREKKAKADEKNREIERVKEEKQRGEENPSKIAEKSKIEEVQEAQNIKTQIEKIEKELNSDEEDQYELESNHSNHLDFDKEEPLLVDNEPDQYEDFQDDFEEYNEHENLPEHPDSKTPPEEPAIPAKDIPEAPAVKPLDPELKPSPQAEEKKKKPKKSKKQQEKSPETLIKHISFRMQINRIPKNKLSALLFKSSSDKPISKSDLSSVLQSNPLNFSAEESEILSSFLIESNKSSAKAVEEKLLKLTENWEIFNPQEEEKFDDAIGETIIKNKDALLDLCKKQDKKQEGQIALKSFKKVLQQLSIKFPEKVMKYMQLLFYSHNMKLDQVPYENFIKAYTEQEEEATDEEKAKVAKHYLGIIAQVLAQHKSNVFEVFECDEHGIIGPNEFFAGLQRIGLEEIEEDHVMVLLEALQFDQAEEVCVHIEELEEILGNFLGEDEKSHQKKVSMLDSGNYELSEDSPEKTLRKESDKGISDSSPFAKPKSGEEKDEEYEDEFN